MSHGIKRVALLFAGGPAPGANAVISTCAISCIRNGIEVVGIRYGYSNLMDTHHRRRWWKDCITRT